jgi:transposase-like protein
VVVEDVLRRAGVELRDRRKLPAVEEWADRYVQGGETVAEIAATFAASPEAVLRALAVAGIERHAAKVRMPPLSDDDVVACYVDEGLSLQATAQQLGVSTPRVRTVVGRLGVLRTWFDPFTIDRKRFARRYAAGATVAELGDEFGLTPHQVTVAVRSFQLSRRLPVTHRPLLISDRQLAALIAAGLSDTDIAARYGAALWGVVRRRRQAGLLRPPPNKVAHRSAGTVCCANSPPAEPGPTSPPPTTSAWPP